MEDGLHSAHLIKGYRTACNLAMQHLTDLSISIHAQEEECAGHPVSSAAGSLASVVGCVDTSLELRYGCSEKRSLLEKCAQTALNSKLIAHQKEFFGKMAVDAVMLLEDDLPINMIGVKKVAGGSLTDSVLVQGVAFKKTFSYAGFEQQPKKFVNPLIVLLNVELELKSEKDNAEVRIKDVADYQAFVDAEWKIIYDKLDAVVATGAKVSLRSQARCLLP